MVFFSKRMIRDFLQIILECRGGNDYTTKALFRTYSFRLFISIILAFGVVTKEQSKTTQFAFNHRVLSAYEESRARNSQ
jgi:hypothetical protein